MIKCAGLAPSSVSPTIHQTHTPIPESPPQTTFEALRTNTKQFPQVHRMVSLAHLITLLSVLVAVSRADEESGTKGAEVDAKWFRTGGLYGGWGAWGGVRLGYLGVPWINNWAGYLGGCYGGAFFPSYYSLYFAKATEAESHSVSRRATRLDAEHLFRREEADKVSCINDKGVTEVFSKSECAK